MNTKKANAKHLRKPAHTVFLEMVKELVESMRTDWNVHTLQDKSCKLRAILEVIDRSVIPEKEIAEFTAGLREVAESFRSYGVGKHIEEVIERLLS